MAGIFASGELKRVPIDGGTPITVARNLAPRVSSWTKDNRILIPTEALARKRSGLSVVSPSGGIPKAFIVSDTAHGENMFAPLAVGDGKTVLFASLGPGGFEDDNLAVGSTSGPDYKVVDFLIRKPLAYVDGYAICLRWDGQQGTIVALPFDLREGKITGDPITLLNGSLEHNRNPLRVWNSRLRQWHVDFGAHLGKREREGREFATRSTRLRDSSSLA